MKKLKAWLYAFRLRTLPLALSSIITGSAIAYTDNKVGFSAQVFALCILTTLLLQILSNLANDYGDSEKGTDNAERIGPVRAVQGGMLSRTEIVKGIIAVTLLCLITGNALVREATRGMDMSYGVFFFALGLFAIAAAIKYTVGKGAYGYHGLGDVFVFLFFGLVGVCGSYFLLAHHFYPALLLPASAVGALSAGVLNLNNMRDAESDARAGKNSLVVKIGVPKAKKYHFALIVIALFLLCAFVVIQGTSTIQFLFIITFPLFRKHLSTVMKTQNPAEFDPQLKVLALSTFFTAVLFAVGMITGAW